MRGRGANRIVGCALALAGALGAQEPSPAAPQPLYRFDSNLLETRDDGDFRETLVFGGMRFSWPSLGIEIRSRNAILLCDRQAVHDRLGEAGGRDGPPTRGIDPPAPRRRLTTAELNQRVHRLLSALGRDPAAAAVPPLAQEALRFLYFEGGVTVLRGDDVVARCERLWISPLDDRLIVEQVELRHTQPDGSPLLLRGPRLEKQGGRWSGRDITVTSCDAGVPHVAVASGELELIEREGQFEIRSRGNALQLGGRDVLPLPDAHFFSGEQSALPLRGFRAGYGGREGGRARLDLGAPFQGIGGDLHEFVTGRPAHEFRGDWNLGLGWTELRGWPLDAAVDYRGSSLYEGRTEVFYLDDGGPDLREIDRHVDGTPINERNRNLVRSDNRLFFGEHTHLDLSLFHAGDPAVYPEFFRGDFRNRELPESSAYLHHAADNLLVTITGRFQSSSFSYRDNRSLAESFVEELPVATVHWLAQPIATTPWNTPIVLDTATEAGLRRRAIDDRAPPGLAPDRTFRADQLAELSAPLLLGPIHVRPYMAGRATHVDADVTGEAAGRTALEAGVRAGTRLSGIWSWHDAAGNEQSLRHVVSPAVTFANRFHVDGDPAQFRQFDELDALTEQSLLRLELRNQLQRMAAGDAGTTPTTRDVLYADLAQDIWPNADRDNGGDQLGLCYYDLQLRPDTSLWPLETLAFGLEGDHDWEDGLRTLDAEVLFGKVLGLDWSFDYRRDDLADAAAGIGAHASLLGRWDISGNVAYDFGRKDVLNYFVGLRRNDHDWSLLAGISYDPFDDEVTFRIEFEPRLFGRGAARDRGWFGPMPGEALRDSLTP